MEDLNVWYLNIDERKTNNLTGIFYEFVRTILTPSTRPTITKKNDKDLIAIN